MEYKFGLGKDRRVLSYHQSKDWMNQIAKFRKYLNMAKGEQSGNAKLQAWMVINIRKPEKVTRLLAKAFAKVYGICPGYVYHLRSSNPHVRKWKHLDKQTN